MAIPSVRSGSAGDLEAMLEHVRAGFASYREFMPASWQPPDMDLERARMASQLARRDTTVFIAEAAGRPIGHLAFFAGRERSPGGAPGDLPLIPGLAHLWQLFVLPAWWGRGAAPGLHQAGIAAMSAEGYTHARLYAFAGQARARAFYERRGWVAVDEQWNEGIAAQLVDYRLRLDGPNR